ncbi:hypothetical protein CBR_g8034 [Chara braunii]|uniref:Large ribosomal subunit protein uL29c n=1 Tax=Chara braunii TaxID=69332 RepID=A0A388KL26_CHABU|nr:hypothetical protein CBR_g8034 [Chara braunii]|eukprot:GBG70737.1 hypothetical protein CBR_g8034 [Chara braunii]
MAAAAMASSSSLLAAGVASSGSLNAASLSCSRSMFSGDASCLRPALVGSAMRRQENATGIFAMANHAQEMTDIRAMSTDDINAAVVGIKRELFDLRMMQATRQEMKTSDYKRLKKRVAKMLTVKRERELEQGINKRQSRKVDKAFQRTCWELY